MRARLVSLDVPEAFDGDVRAFQPADPGNLCVLVDAVIAPADGGLGESFHFRVCTPEWLITAQRARGFEFVRHTLLVERWDPELVERAIAELCAGIEERDWAALSAALARYGRWEFDAVTVAA